jgi:hypothetical protein
MISRRIKAFDQSTTEINTTQQNEDKPHSLP